MYIIGLTPRKKSNYYIKQTPETTGNFHLQNKRPKGPHIVHLSTMCHIFDRSARAAIFVYSSAWKHKLGCWDLAFPVRFRWIPFSGFRGEVKNVSANQKPGQPSCFPTHPKDTTLEEDVEHVEILLSVEFCWIPFSSFRGEVENVSTNQRPYVIWRIIRCFVVSFKQDLRLYKTPTREKILSFTELQITF